MISHKHGFVFIHINKTGGTSIVKSLGVRSDHPRAKRALEYSQKKAWENYFKFTFVRNPWDKECSDYHYHSRLWHKKTNRKKLSFEEYLKLPELHPQHKKYFWHSNQLDWLRSLNHEIEMDFIGRFESLQEDFNTVCDRIGMPRRQLPHKNSSSHDGYTKYYTDETREIVANLYAKDIEYFGYRFGE